MKVFKITGKNLKILARSKTTLLMVVFGPLLIMLLVGFAFNSTSTSKLNIGYVTDKSTNLTQSFIQALNDNPNFLVVSSPSETQCVNMIQQGKVHLCIIFPDDFSVDNNKTNNLVFYVDQSRTNFVYAIIDTVSSKISLTSTQLSYQMTNDLLSVIDSTKRSDTEQLASIIALKSSVDDMSTKLKDVQSKLSNLDLTPSSVQTGTTNGPLSTISSDISDLQTRGNTVITDGQSLGAQCGGGNCGNLTAQFTSAGSDLTTKFNVTSTDLDTLNSSLSSLSNAVDKINQKLINAQTTTTDSSTTVDDNVKALAQLKTSLDDLKSSIETTNAQINALRVTSAESIVNPITTTIKPISSKSSNLNFIFPYFLILIIVFISIMLSSSIIIVEKTSKAYFRNFTTPTKDLTFVMSVFLTSFFVVLIQIVFILALAYYFLNASIFDNFGLTAILLLCSIALFTMIGMIIGYLFNSQEAVMMASISVGSVFLFLSNLILPLESMSAYIQNLAKFNPYVITSELLKKLTVFNSSWADVSSDFLIIAIYLVVAFALVLIIQKASKVQFISKKPITKQLMAKEPTIDKYFKLKNGVLLMSEKDLLYELEKMSDKEFEEYVTKRRNDFESWLILNKKHDLAKKIKECKTKKDMINALQKYKDDITVDLNKKQ